MPCAADVWRWLDLPHGRAFPDTHMCGSTKCNLVLSRGAWEGRSSITLPSVCNCGRTALHSVNVLQQVKLNWSVCTCMCVHTWVYMYVYVHVCVRGCT